MTGIVFFSSKDINHTTNFYLSKIGANVWLEQEDCIILQFNNMLFGFCERKEIDRCGIITFVFENEKKVNSMYERLEDLALNPPQKNEKYDIYHFFAKDPEGRKIEFQTFLHETPKIQES